MTDGQGMQNNVFFKDVKIVDIFLNWKENYVTVLVLHSITKGSFNFTILNKFLPNYTVTIEVLKIRKLKKDFDTF